MKEAIHEILTDVSDSFSQMIDMALANEIQVSPAHREPGAEPASIEPLELKWAFTGGPESLDVSV